MAQNQRWVGNAPLVAQVDTITLATYDVTTTNTISFGTVSVAAADSGGTTTTSAAALTALVAASTLKQFTQITWTSSGAIITATAVTAGVPNAITAAASGGTGTVTLANVTPNSGPNDINVQANWLTSSSIALPGAGDTVIIDQGSVSLMWNLSAFSAVTLAALYRRQAHTGTIGLPEVNAAGGYFEYRATELTIGATLQVIEIAQQDQAAAIKLNNGSVQTTLTITGFGPSALGSEIVWWRGTHASNVVKCVNGSIAIGAKGNLAATVATLTLEGSSATIGQTVTLTTVNVLNSQVALYSGCTTLSISQLNGSSTVSIYGTAAFTTINANQGTVNYNSTGTIGTLNLGPQGKIDFSQGAGNVTITNAIVLQKGSVFYDPLNRTLAGGLVFTLAAGVTLDDVTIILGSTAASQRTYTVT